MRRLLPFLTKHVLPFAKTALKNVAVDVLDGNRNLKESISEHGVGALKGVGQSLLAQSGSGVRAVKRKKPTKKPPSSKKRKKSRNIFEEYESQASTSSRGRPQRDGLVLGASNGR
jgi:hypothetical protein